MMTLALLLLLTGSFEAGLVATQETGEAPPTEVDILQYQEIAAHSFASISNGDRGLAGLALSKDGLVLVQAHLLGLSNGLRATATLARKGSTQPYDVVVHAFDSVTVVGIHPHLDLALVQIRISDPGISFKPIVLAKSRVLNRDHLILSGPDQAYPQNRRSRTTGAGEREGYFLLDTPPGPGTWVNGLFVFNDQAEAVGMGSPILEGGKVVAGVISLVGLRKEDFVKPRDYRSNPERTLTLIETAERLLEPKADPLTADPLDFASAQYLIELSLVGDSGDRGLYLRIGRALSKDSTTRHRAVPFLARAIAVDPWSDQVRSSYDDLATGLSNQSRPEDARILWKETVAKYPAESPRSWTALAHLDVSKSNYSEAGLESQLAIRTKTDEPEVMERLYGYCLEHLDSVGKDRLEGKVRDLDKILSQMNSAADVRRNSGKPYMSAEAEKLFVGLTGMTATTGAAPSPSRHSAPRPPLLEDVDLIPAFIRARVRIASEHAKEGRRTEAVSILEDLIREFPKHPQIDEARRLLSDLQKQ